MAFSTHRNVEEWFSVWKVVKIRIENADKIYGVRMDEKIEA